MTLSPHVILSLSTYCLSWHSLPALMRITDSWFTFNTLCINKWLKCLKNSPATGRWWGYLQRNANTTLLNRIGKGGRATGLLAKLIRGWPQTLLLAVPASGPIALLVVPALVIAAWVLLHGVWKIPLSWGMPAGLLENKPDVSSPENEVQESKDLKENKSKFVIKKA